MHIYDDTHMNSGMTFTIKIPEDNVVVVEDKLRLLKQLLVYLETPICRKLMKEEERRQKIKNATEHFRRLLMYKSYDYFTSS